MQLVRVTSILVLVLGGCGGGGATQDVDGSVDPVIDAAAFDGPIDAAIDAVPIVAPGSPTNVVAVWGDHSATITWDPPADDGGSPIVEYEVIDQDDNPLQSATSSPTVALGLQNGRSYAFRVVARNEVGDSPPSAPSNEVIPAGLPDPPSAPVASTGTASGEIALTWNPPSSTNGRPITSYTVTSDPDGLTRSTTGTSLTFTGLRNSVTYQFRVTATTEVGTSEPSSPSNVAEAVLPVCTGTVTYTALTPVPVGTHPIALATGHINPAADDHLDLVVSNNGSNTVQALLSDGAGGWTVGAPVAVGAQPRGVVLADLDSDGHLDIAVANYGAGTVQVLIGDGTGGFTARPAMAVGTNPTSLVAVDANRDFRRDLVVTNFGSNTASILLANASGGFNAATTLATYGFPYAIAAADLDGNGYSDDLAIGHGTANAGLFNSNGNGTYAAPTSLPYNTNQHGILLADLDSNGRADLVQTSTTNNTLQLRLQSTSATWGAPVTHNVGNEPKSISAGDLDGDGDLDLVVSNRSGGTLSVLRSSAPASFAAAQTINVGAGSFPWAVVAIDTDTDTDADLVTARYGMNDLVVYRVGCTP